jgi:hypothetical protein
MATRLGRVVWVLGAVWLVVLFGASVARAAPTPVCTGTPAGATCGGWFNSDVTVTWSDPACAPETLTQSTTAICNGADGQGSADVKIDKQAPTVSGAAPPPNANGWHTAPVTIGFTGSDAESGVASCSSVTYSGPDSAAATVTGTCTDNAGNVGSGSSAPFNYDATPPSLSGLMILAADNSLAVSWQAGADAASVQVIRTPGIAAQSSVVFTGPADNFVDRFVKNGSGYAYQVTIRDAAGNATTQTVVGVPGSPAITTPTSPPPGTATVNRVHKVSRIQPAARATFFAGDPPRLRWIAPRRARYFNLQLYKNGRKILSVWPRHPHYQLHERWRFARVRHRLTAGRYRWIVWPGFGKISKAIYGKPLVNRTFVVRRSIPPA